MALNCTALSLLPFFRSVNVKENIVKASPSFANTALPLSRTKLGNDRLPFTSVAFLRSPFLGGSFRKTGLRASKIEEILECDDDGKEAGGKSSKSDELDDDDDDFMMDEDERKELRKMIRQVIEMNPEVKEETDPEERRKKMQKLLTDYPLVVEEEDPDWPEDADGHGFSLDQFFNKVTIKNAKKEDDDDDGENDIVWRDDDYIRPIKDITAAEWEETVFKDISPLVILVHNRYKRPKQNEQIREELEEAVNIIWNCSLPSPRCVAVDAVVECDLVSTLGVSIFPELIFTKSGKILHREIEIRTADELSKIMAFFYFGAAKPPCLDTSTRNEAQIPGFSVSGQ